jgi:hypothetical protein
MRILYFLAFMLFAGGSANGAIIQIDYTGTYTGTVTTGNPAISESTTVQVGPAPFTLQIVFNTADPYGSLTYFDTPSSSALYGFNSLSLAMASLSFGGGLDSEVYASDTAATGTTSQILTSRVYSKTISYSSLNISVAHPEIPGSITKPFTILQGLTGSGTYDSGDYVGNFSSFYGYYNLYPQTIRVTVDGISAAVPELSIWAMMILGFAGLGSMSYRRRREAAPAV